MPSFNRRASRVRVSLLALGLLIATPFALADSVDELRVLVDGNDAAAWDMAQRMEPESAGEPEFDFWYGLAAKAAGKKNQAVFAFERVVLNQPGNARAKLELADAYYLHGNTGEAKRLFDEVLATTPPDAVQQRIRTYLGVIEAADKNKSTQVSSYVTLAGGYDSNVNSSTEVVNQDIGGTIIPLDPTSLGSDAGFMDVRGGVEIVQPVNQRTLRFLGLTAQRRDNADVLSGGNFDYTQLGLTGGLMLHRGTATWRLPVSVQALWAESESVLPVNDDRFVFTVGAEYSRPLTSRTGMVCFAQAGTTNYQSSDDRDALLMLVGTGYNWTAASAPLRLSTTLHFGAEPARDDAFEYNGRTYVAARLNLRYTLAASQTLYGALGVQKSMYDDTHPLLLIDREDTLLDASAGWQLQLDRDWSLNVDLLFADNSSADTDLYDYDRTQVKLGSTWRF